MRATSIGGSVTENVTPEGATGSSTSLGPVVEDTMLDVSVHVASHERLVTVTMKRRDGATDGTPPGGTLGFPASARSSVELRCGIPYADNAKPVDATTTVAIDRVVLRRCKSTI